MADKLEHLKMEKQERVQSVITESEYPYGLELCLDCDTLEKLGVKELPAVGSVMKIQAMATVVSVSERMEHGEKDDTDKRMSLQITHMSLGSGPKKSVEESAAEKLYGEE